MSQDSSHQSFRSLQISTSMCNCGEPACQLTSFTYDENFGRRLLTCSNYWSTRRCDFFIWIDPPMCEHGKRLLFKIRRLRDLPARNRERVNRNAGNEESTWKLICLVSWCILLGIIFSFWMKDIVKF